MWSAEAGLPCGAVCRWPGGVPGAALAVLPFSDGDMGVLRGKSLGISHRSAQVARLRYSLLAISEK